jgi:YD repeat-containing protein
LAQIFRYSKIKEIIPFMQKIILTGIFFLVLGNIYSQFYYNDIVSLKESNRMYLTLKKNNIRGVSATSMESDNTPTEGFAYSKEIKNNGSLIVTRNQLATSGASVTYEYYTNDRLTQSTDSSFNLNTKIQYKYDQQGNISSIETLTDDTSRQVSSTEIHKWFYTGNTPDSMLRIKENTDTTVIHFKKDEKENITEEIWMKRGKTIEHYYYYYNDQSQLTDIVRFNPKAKQMLPDFLFQYDANGIISQMTQVPEGSSDYVIWQYLYDDKGLKIKDVLFDKHQELLGTVTYSYQ